MRTVCGAAAMVAMMVVGCGGSSEASDLSAQRSGPSLFSPAPISTWTGLYVGLNVGGGWGTTNHSATASLGALTGSTGDFDVGGPIFGGTVGYNMQMGPWVFGGEADLDWAEINGSKTFSGTVNGTPATGTFSSSLDWIDTIRARIGYSFGPSLVYFTGGAAYGSVKAAVTGSAITGLGAVAGSLGQSDTRLGWTLGVGLEYMFARQWSGKLEYLYVDLGTNQQVLVDNVKFNTNILRTGMNWRF